ncbi:uncharacterized protein LOC130613519 [Hydractinia symbiolongicarpus]|uniref:uncharacterized protein LOC130613519 n=1 Tax=Hydractinia symbiolongicarpus TaxID=13093 RepID=UPI00254AD004|nr:uncharacterized protein LOC130613519 [Hydractinia symbiolongicarpus]
MTTICACSQGQTQINMESKSCQKCKHFLSLVNFRVLKNGQTTKTCIKCLDKAKHQRAKNKCPHQRVRAYCKDCKDTQICRHGKPRSQCKKCGGSQICPYQRERAYCKQ